MTDVKKADAQNPLKEGNALKPEETLKSIREENESVELSEEDLDNIAGAGPVGGDTSN